MCAAGCTLQIVLTLVACVRCWALASPMPTRRVALVTGSNKGIGKEIARRLAAEGLTTIIGCRSAELGEAAADELRGGELRGRGGGGGGDDGGDDGMDVVFQRLDLTDPKSVDDVREFIAQNYGRLDVLVNNAAICFNDPTLYGKCAHTPFERQADITVTTNFFGTLGVTRALLPLLRAAPSPRVINIASAAGRLSILRSQEKAAAFSSPAVEIDEIAGLMTEFVADVESGVHAEKGWANTCYGMSKLGIIAMTRALARDEPAVLVSSVDPGYCATDQNANRGTLSAVQGAQTPVALALLPAPSSSSPASSEFRSGAHFFYDGSEIDWLRS